VPEGARILGRSTAGRAPKRATKGPAHLRFHRDESAIDSVARELESGEEAEVDAVRLQVPARSLSFLLGRRPFTPPAGGVGPAASLGSKPGTCSRGTHRPWRFSMRRKCASVDTLTKLTASPAAPARAVRPMRCA
jgi:hypothetical protein